MSSCETCIETHDIMEKAPDCTGCPTPDADRQRVIDRARAVAASWEQWCNAPEEDRTVMWGFVERGMKFLTMALDEMDGVDQNTVRPEVVADLERDIAEYGELWKELAKR